MSYDTTYKFEVHFECQLKKSGREIDWGVSKKKNIRRGLGKSISHDYGFYLLLLIQLKKTNSGGN